MSAAGKFLRATGRGFLHWCPGCKNNHHINTKTVGPPCWSFNDDFQKPTFSPSILITQEVVDEDFGGSLVCHYFIREGRIEFCGDSTHELSGKVIDLPPFQADSFHTKSYDDDSVQT